MNRTIAFLLLVQKDTAGAVLQLQIALGRTPVAQPSSVPGARR
jgi:hypothetical protein